MQGVFTSNDAGTKQLVSIIIQTKPMNEILSVMLA